MRESREDECDFFGRVRIGARFQSAIDSAVLFDERPLNQHIMGKHFFKFYASVSVFVNQILLKKKSSVYLCIIHNIHLMPIDYLKYNQNGRTSQKQYTSNQLCSLSRLEQPCLDDCRNYSIEGFINQIDTESECVSNNSTYHRTGSSIQWQ